MKFSQAKFLSLPLKRQHKQAAELLKLALIKDSSLLSHYHELASWMGLSIPASKPAYYDRYDEHLRESLSPLPTFDSFERSFDPISHAPYLPITVYLDNLRSAFNVGSILRTMEAFRFESAYFAKNTPFADQKKLQDTSMGTYELIDCHKDLSRLKRPWIALEVTESATPVYDFSFPTEMTLVLGNEAYGISEEVLNQCDHIVSIPLVGAKNSLNVASAFAIAAYEIRRQIFTRI